MSRLKPRPTRPQPTRKIADDPYLCALAKEKSERALDYARTSWGAPFEAQGKAVLRPYMILPIR
jgi:hypothetical protein